MCVSWTWYICIVCIGLWVRERQNLSRAPCCIFPDVYAPGEPLILGDFKELDGYNWDDILGYAYEAGNYSNG
jgi:hypothetical protein